MAPFTLAIATPSDLPELAQLMYKCFSTWTTLRFMGCHSAEDLPKFVALYTKIMNEDPSDIWIKVTDKETGNIIAATNWKLYLKSDKAMKRQRVEVPEWLEGEDVEKSKQLLEPSNEARLKSNPEPFLHLNICFSSADYRRRGAGTMMMKWGNELADSLFLPCWVEASVTGTELYKAAGYYTDFVIQLGGPEGHTVNAMRRDARTKLIEGGKAAPVVNGV